MNALYDAPIDESGNPMFAEVDLKARLERLSPRPAPRDVAEQRARQHQEARGPPPVEHGVPWREERVVDAAVRVSPAVEEEPVHECRRQQAHDPAEPACRFDALHHHRSWC